MPNTELSTEGTKADEAPAIQRQEAVVAFSVSKGNK